MPLKLHVELRHGLRQNARQAHEFVIRPCSQGETRTLYHLHDVGGMRVSIVTDDLNYDPAKWGNQVRNVQVNHYDPQPSNGKEYHFRLRLDRSRRGVIRTPLSTDEELDGLLTRMMDRAGGEVLSYDVRHDIGYSVTGQKVEIPIATFEGVVIVKEASHFRQALLQGIGRSKRFGCGLLMVQ